MVHGIPKSKMTSRKADGRKHAQFSMTIHNETRYTDNKQNGEHDNENSKFNQPRRRSHPTKIKKCSVSTEIDTKTIFGMASLKITLSMNSDKGVGRYLATDVYVMKLIKLYWLLDLSPMNPIDSLYIHLEPNNNV